MEMRDYCLACFLPTGGYEVCPHCGFVQSTQNNPAYMLQPGTQLLGRYVVGTILGIGGFGVTYKAYDLRLSSIVAIKEFFPQNLAARLPRQAVLRPYTGQQTEEYEVQLSHFLAEAQQMAQFGGEANNIVNVLDFFTCNNTAYIVMEYLEGETLKEHLAARGGRLPQEEAAAVMDALLCALSCIHKKGVLHRDVSPDNIFMLQDGRIKLLDFGAARFSTKEEWTQNVVVKKGYAPPEQYRSNMKQSPRTDLYAAGATWYKMLTGDTPEESIQRWEKDRLQRPSQNGAAVEIGVDRAVMKALALRPELRFASAEEMQKALHGQANCNFPEEEIKKQKRLRLALGLLLLALVTLGGAFTFWQLSAEPEVRIENPTLADFDIAPETFSVVVEAGQEDAYRALAGAFMQQYPQHQVEIVGKTPEEMQAGGIHFSTPDAPALFFAFPGGEALLAADVSPLLLGLNKEQYYLYGGYMDALAQNPETPNPNTVYLGMEMENLVFVNLAKTSLWTETLPSALTSPSQLMQPQREGLVEEIFLTPAQYLTLIAQYYPDKYQDGKFTFTEEDTSLFKYYLHNYRPPTDSFAIKPEARALFMGGSTPASMNQAKKYWPGQVTLLPFTKNGNANIHFRDGFLVNASVSENRQKAGMLFLHFLLGEYAQTQLYGAGERCLPLHRAAMETYCIRYPFAKGLEPFLLYNSEVFTELPADFVQGLETLVGETGNSEMSEMIEKILAYCAEYAPTS